MLFVTMFTALWLILVCSYPRTRIGNSQLPPSIYEPVLGILQNYFDLLVAEGILSSFRLVFPALIIVFCTTMRFRSSYIGLSKPPYLLLKTVNASTVCCNNFQFNFLWFTLKTVNYKACRKTILYKFVSIESVPRRLEHP